MRLPPLYAHRLGRAYGPDSSLLALERSLAGGVDGLETDCCLTADGQLMLLHDPLLALGTTLEGLAHQQPAADIRAARLRGPDGSPTDQRPLGLDELLAAAPAELPVQVEVKALGDPALASRTATVLCERFRAERERIEVISFWSAACAAAAAAALLRPIRRRERHGAGERCLRRGAEVSTFAPAPSRAGARADPSLAPANRPLRALRDMT